jgi:hypothetical protein
MFFDRTVRTVGSVAALAVSMLFGVPVQATVVTAIDEFVITRSGLPSGTPEYLGQSVFYRDSFSDGAEPASGGTFFNGATGTYALNGSFPDGSESNGKLTLDSSRGGPFVNAAGIGRRQQLTTLLTDIDPSTQAGLKQAFHTFSVIGLFDLVLPSTIADGYGIYVNDGGPLGRTESIDLMVRREENNNLVIRFQEQDFLNGKINTLELDTLVVPTDATQIELLLHRDNLESSLLTASYRFWSGGSASDFTDMSASAFFFTNNDWARGGFFTVEAVPEPGTVALLLLGVAGLVATRKPRR